jgi:protein-S-isoprenylcysteine O-methyltransferase Ste14
VPFTEPWFWAFLSAAGWATCSAIVGTRTPGRSLRFGIPAFLLAELPRAVLPLPFVSQPRIAAAHPVLITAGAVILAASLFFATPVFRIAPLTAPARHEPLRTDGLYSVVRHPLMVCDIFWPLGWSLIFASIIGAALTPAWLLVVWALTQVEEDSLVREYGDAYRDLQAHVPRLLPRLRNPVRGKT